MAGGCRGLLVGGLGGGRLAAQPLHLRHPSPPARLVRPPLQVRLMATGRVIGERHSEACWATGCGAQKPFVAQSGRLSAQTGGGIDIGGSLRMMLPMVMMIGMMARLLSGGPQKKVDAGEKS